MLHYTVPILNAFINETKVRRQIAFSRECVLHPICYVVLGQGIERV